MEEDDDIMKDKIARNTVHLRQYMWQKDGEWIHIMEENGDNIMKDKIARNTVYFEIILTE
jgi:hypothetical protein